LAPPLAWTSQMTSWWRLWLHISCFFSCKVGRPGSSASWPSVPPSCWLMDGIYPEMRFEAWSCAKLLHMDPWIQGTCLSTVGCISLWCAGQDCLGMCFSACMWKLNCVGRSARPAGLGFLPNRPKFVQWVPEVTCAPKLVESH
jgi:hypothetical protein